MSSGNFFIGHHEKNGRGLYASRDVTKNESIFKKKKKKKNEQQQGGRRDRGAAKTNHESSDDLELRFGVLLVPGRALKEEEEQQQQ